MTSVTGGLVYPVDPLAFGGIVHHEPSAATELIDWAGGPIHLVDLPAAPADVTLVFANPRDGATYHLIIVRDGGGNTIDGWPSEIRWSGGAAPTLLSSGNGPVYDLIELVYEADSELYLGYPAGAAALVANDLATLSSSLASVAFTASASDINSGTLSIARIADGTVTLAKLANIAADTMIGRASAGTGVPEAITVTAAARAFLDDVDAAAQRTTLALAAVAASGSASDLTTGTLPIARIADGDVTLAKLAGIATARFLGRTAAGTGAPEALTGTQATAMLNVRTESLPGLMPANMGRRASLATNLSIANTLTQVVGFTAAAGTLSAGTVIRFDAVGLQTNSTTAATSVMTLRINSASLGSTIEASWSVAMGTTARTNCPFKVTGFITIVTAGVGGSARGCLHVDVNTATQLATPTSMVTSAVTCSTIQSNVVELTCISGHSSATWNFIAATAEVVNP